MWALWYVFRYKTGLKLGSLGFVKLNWFPKPTYHFDNVVRVPCTVYVGY